MEVIFVDRLRDYKAGVAKTTNIDTVLMNNIRKGTCIISDEVWE